MARPRQEIRIALRQALEQGPGTSKELRQRACTSKQLTAYTLDNMCRAGEAWKPHSVRVPGVKRPVPVYALCELGARDDGPSGALLLQAAWGVGKGADLSPA